MPDRSLVGRRIGVVVATTTGGTGRHAVAVVCAAVAAGAEVVVAGPAATERSFGFADAGARFAPVEIASGLRPVRDVVAWRSARSALAGCELVHAHGLRAGFIGSAAAASTARLVVTWHNAVLATGAGRRVLALAERQVARAADVTLCVSSDLTARVRALGGKDVRTAPVGSSRLVTTGRDRRDVREELGVGAGDDLVLAVGRLHPQKGFDVLVAAAGIVSRRRAAPTRFVIAGDGPLREDLAALIARTQAPVDLLGWREDTGDLLAAADLVVMPSRWEGSPLSAHETLLAGRPLVATSVGGLPELLGTTAARLVAVDDPPALAEAVVDLLDDEVERLALGERGRARGEDWPDADRAAQLVVDLYADLLGST